VIIIRYLHTKA